MKQPNFALEKLARAPVGRTAAILDGNGAEPPKAVSMLTNGSNLLAHQFDDDYTKNQCSCAPKLQATGHRNSGEWN